MPDSLEATFDPSAAVRFDLRRGSAFDDRGHRVVLFPMDAIDGLEDAQAEGVGVRVGEACGARMAARVGGHDAACRADFEPMVTQLAGELALTGIGVVHFERWGKALVACVVNPATASAAFVSGVLSGALSAATAKAIAAQWLGTHDGAMRYLLCTRFTAAHVRALLAEGKPVGEVLTSIQQEPS